jgi:dienelactone hydrolase
MSYKSLCALLFATLLPSTFAFAESSLIEEGRIILPLVDFDESTVEIPAARDYTAPSNLYVPKTAGSRNLPAMLLAYGAQGDKDVDYITEIARGMAARGFVVLIMDMPGRGSRTETSPEPSDNEDTVRWYMEDYKMGVDYLVRHPAVNPNKLSYAGTSLGAITGIPFCAKDQRIKTCVSIVGGGQSNSGLPRELDCVRMVSEIAPRATMLINGTLDFVIPYFMAQNLHSRVKPPFEKIWYQADHYLRDIDKDDLYDRMGRFILAH